VASPLSTQPASRLRWWVSGWMV